MRKTRPVLYIIVSLMLLAAPVSAQETVFGRIIENTNNMDIKPRYVDSTSVVSSRKNGQKPLVAYVSSTGWVLIICTLVGLQTSFYLSHKK